MSVVNDKRRLGREDENGPVKDRDVDPGPEVVEETPGQAEAELVDPAEELAALKDQNLRLHAEFDNYRKRSEREATSFRKYAQENLIRELLPQIDNLERALAAAEGQDSLIDGLKMTLKGIHDVLARFGVSRVAAVGEPFDPNVHEAIAAQENSEVDDNTVLVEHQSGYMLHDRLIRPAMVVISKRPAG